MPVITPGDTLGGRYRVVRLLGEGAMGAVYEAEHALIGRRVALKVLHERFSASAEAVERFHAEARATAAIGHPHIVDVLDFGSDAGRPYLVMELLRGETLAERLSRSPALDATDACRIVGEVLSGVAAAHEIGVVHRDLKPENIILTRGERAKVVDFGVSKFREAEGAARGRTREGMLLGTPGYIAPEQWIGAPSVDHRADLFSVGVILYELLTGGLPYEGSTRAELYQEMVHGDAPPPTPSSIAPECPASLDAIALRAVHRDPAQRFQSAGEFLAALVPHGAAASSGRFEAQPPPPALPPLDTPRTTHPTVLDGHSAPARSALRGTVLATLLAMALALSVAVATARSRTPSPAPAAPAPPAVIAAPPAPAPAPTPTVAVAPALAPPTAAAPLERAPARRHHARPRITHRW
ncbi:MAG: serine/threonine-protein kinase [Polyangiales bacterium]